MTSILTPEEVERIAETLPKPDTGLAECHPSWGLGYRKDADGKYTIPVPPGNVHPFAAALESAILAKLASRAGELPPSCAYVDTWRNDGPGTPCTLHLDSANAPYYTQDALRSHTASLAARVEVLERALRLCAAVVGGETMHKQGLIDALEAARAALFPAKKD